MISEQSRMNKSVAFTPQMRMVDLIQADYHLLPIIGHFEIEYGFGNKTVQEVCESQKINLSFFLEIMNLFHDSQYLSSSELLDFNMTTIISYLVNSHHSYTRLRVPQIVQYIEQMEEQLEDSGAANIQLIRILFEKYREGFTEHLKSEEQIIFPYAMALETAAETGVFEDELLVAIASDPIMTFEIKHINIESSLSDLQNLIIRHLPPVLSRDLCQQLLSELYNLVTDLEKHMYVEEQILVSKIKCFEQLILEKSGRKTK